MSAEPRFLARLPRRVAGVLLAVLVGTLGLVACGGSSEDAGSEAGVDSGETSEAGESAELATDVAGAPETAGAGRGLYVRRLGKQRFRFEPWVSEDEANRIFRTMRRFGGGEVHFAPGTYEVEQGFYLSHTPGLTISGSPGTLFEFAPPPEFVPLTTREILAGDTSIEVDDATNLRVGWDYQLYAQGRDSSRVLEFTIASIEGQRVELTGPVKYMPMITEIPAGARVLEELNFFEVFSCPDIVFEGLTMDGKDRGTVRGHTLYGGIYASGMNPGQERPTISGLTVRACTFRNLRGRAVAAYGVADVLVTRSTFRDIFAQAIEIDHFSSGTVVGNLVDGAEVGVMLNDCFDSMVEANVFLRCTFGVRFLRIFPQEWVNHGNTVRDNRFGFCEHGVVFNDNLLDGVVGNYVLDNHFVGIPPLERVVNGRGNVVRGSTHE